MNETKIKEPEALNGSHYTYADYLNFDFDEMVEIIRGKIFRMSPAPGSLHQKVSRNLCGVAYNYFKNKPCQFFNAPFDVILPKKRKDFMDSDKVVQPDIAVICNSDIIQEKGCFGVPDWIIEILSPHTAKKDIQDKFDLYEEAGVKEYWIIEPSNKTVEVFFLHNDKYQRIKAYTVPDHVSPQLFPDLTFVLNEVFA